MNWSLLETNRLIIEAVEAAELIPGWMDHKALMWLATNAISLSKGATWLEIGTFCGRSALCVGLVLPPSSVLWIVDDFDKNNPFHTGGKKWYETVQNADWEITNETPYERFLRTLAQLKSKRGDISVKFLNCSSNLIPKNIPPKSVDVAFIDANHTFDLVVADCKLCKELVKPGGMVCGHDYGSDASPDVRLAVMSIQRCTLWHAILPE